MQLIERGQPSLLERLIPELAEYLLCSQVTLTEQVSRLSQGGLLVLLAYLSLPAS